MKSSNKRKSNWEHANNLSVLIIVVTKIIEIN